MCIFVKILIIMLVSIVRLCSVCLLLLESFLFKKRFAVYTVGVTGDLTDG